MSSQHIMLFFFLLLFGAFNAWINTHANESPVLKTLTWLGVVASIVGMGAILLMALLKS